MRITADTGRCVGAGQCVLTAGDVFDQDEEGVVTVLVAEPDEGKHGEAVRLAAELCPSAALTVD